MSVCASKGGPAGHTGDHGGRPGAELRLFDRSPTRLAKLDHTRPESDLRITTASPETKAFFNQGLTFLYAGLPQEAERSFRTARHHDPVALMPYWGIATSHLLRDPESAGLWLHALQATTNAAAPHSDVELTLLDTLPDPAVIAATNKTQWRSELVERLRSAISRFPAEPELKAILAGILATTWHPFLDEFKATPDDIQSLIQDVEKQRPQHPVTRAGLHLWANELRHDPYHTKKKYFDLKTLKLTPSIPVHWSLASRYLAERQDLETALQFSERASISHHHNATTWKIAPDQMPDYARHRAAQARLFQSAGNAEAALAIARDLLRVPRHPVWNSPDNLFGSAYQGRRLLIETHLLFGFWNDLIATLGTGNIPEMTGAMPNLELAHAKAIASYFLKDRSAFEQSALRVKQLAETIRADFTKRHPDKKPDSTNAHHDEILQWLNDGGEEYLAALDRDRSLDALALFQSGDPDTAAEILSRCRRVPDLLRARLLWNIGKHREARQALLNAAEIPLALRVHLAKADEEDPAKFPLQFPPHRPQSDLNKLGLSAWAPTDLPPISIPLLNGRTLTNASFPGKNTALIFIYSSTCGHCVEQLDSIQKESETIRSAGLEVVVIAGEAAGSLGPWVEERMGFPAVFASNPDHSLFRALGAYDEFDDLPLHGTVYVNPAGKVLWKDVGDSPFEDIRFFIRETSRLHQAYPGEPVRRN